MDDLGEPIPPSETDTGLRQLVAMYPIASVTYPSETTARYTVTIPKEDLAGVSISEAALVDEAGVYNAIKTMYAKRKDEGVSFELAFDDEF